VVGFGVEREVFDPSTKAWTALPPMADLDLWARIRIRSITRSSDGR